MATYKITNITYLAGKRDPKFNSNIDIEYVVNMKNQSITVKPNTSIYLTIPKLPLSVHRLRIKGLVTVVEIGVNELNEVIEGNNKKLNKAIESEHNKNDDLKKAKKKTKTELE